MTVHHKTAVLVFARGEELDRKVFGLGARADRLAKRAMLVHTLAVAEETCDASHADLVVAFDGEIDLPDVAVGLEQTGASFEERLLRAVDATFALGYERIVVIGADTPQIRTDVLVDAVRDDAPVVGPSVDGGFYLFSLTRDQRDLLRGLPWKTDRVLRCLVGRLTESGQRFTVLERLRDLDDSRAARAQHALLAELVRSTLGVDLTNRATCCPHVVSRPHANATCVREASPRGPPRRAA